MSSCSNIPEDLPEDKCQKKRSDAFSNDFVAKMETYFHNIENAHELPVAMGQMTLKEILDRSLWALYQDFFDDNPDQDIIIYNTAGFVNSDLRMPIPCPEHCLVSAYVNTAQTLN